MVVAAFVAPFLMPATVRFVATAAQLPGVRLGRDHHRRRRSRCRRSWPSTSPGTGGWTTRSTRGRSREAVAGPVPAARPVRAAGRGPGAAAGAARPGPRGARHPGHGRRDRAQRAGQVPDEGRCCAPPACRAPATGWSPTRPTRSRSPTAVGFPLVAKPPAGAGAQATYRLDDADALRSWLGALPAAARRRPGCSRSSSSARSTRSTASPIGGQTVWASVSDYLPPPLEVLRNPWIQWTVLLPRELDDPRYAAIREVGPAALRALGRARRADAHGVVPPPGRLGRGVRGRAPGRRAPSSRRCSATCTTWTSTGCGPSW